MLGGPLKGVVAMVGHAVLTAVVAEVVSVMEMMREMGSALVGVTNATVVLDEGKIFLLSFSGCMPHLVPIISLHLYLDILMGLTSGVQKVC